MKGWAVMHYRKALLVAFSLLFLVLGFNLFRSVDVSAPGFIYYVTPGASKSQVVSDLSAAHVIPNPRFFLFYAEMHSGTALKSGEYLIRPGTSMRALWLQLSRGTGHYYRQFTIIPGWTFLQVRHSLASNPYVRHTLDGIDDATVMSLIAGKTLSPEGQFLPETYFYQRNDVDIALLKRAYNLMQTTLSDAWRLRDPDLPYVTPYDALIAASLIEREAYLSAERPVIAGVLVNRLNQHMRLQFDPTVIYGMGDRYQGSITKADLREDTPYNTYLHTGLPPTPIAMPSASTLNAALHPLRHDYLYFVARGDGSHQFSKDLKEHNAAVQKALIHKMGSLNNIKTQKQLSELLTGKLNMLVYPVSDISLGIV